MSEQLTPPAHMRGLRRKPRVQAHKKAHASRRARN